MSTTYSVSVRSPELMRWIEDNVGEGAVFANKNILINEALKLLKATIEDADPADLTFETKPVGVTESQIKELKAEMGAMMVIDCLPPVPPGEKPQVIHTSIRFEDARLIDLALTLPGLYGRNRPDMVRSLVFIGLKALEEIRTINSEEWQTQMALAEQPVIRERRKRNEERLSAMVKNFKDDLLALCQQGRWEDALDALREFYLRVQQMEWFLREAAMYSLREMPIVQAVLWKWQNEQLPPDLPVPVVAPDGFRFHTDDGVYKPGMAIPGSARPPIQYLPSGS